LRPPAGTAEFGVKNIIYRWNYSEKTTLSRVFSHLERGDYPQDLGGYNFVVDTDTGYVNGPCGGVRISVFEAVG
jgi:hypothetical protein